MKTSINNDTIIDNDINVTLVLTPSEFFTLRDCVSISIPKTKDMQEKANNLWEKFFSTKGIVYNGNINNRTKC